MNKFYFLRKQSDKKTAVEQNIQRLILKNGNLGIYKAIPE